MEKEASQAFVDRLLDRTIGPDITYRHAWRPGDLILWDNRGVMHRAHADYDLEDGRVMHRVLLDPAEEVEGVLPEHVLESILDSVEVPR